MTKTFRLKLFLGLIRAVFPRWNFFDLVGYNFQVSFKDSDQKDWQVLLFSAERKAFHFLQNEECNLTLAQVNVLEHFAQDIQKNSDLSTTVSYLMLVEVLRHKLQKEKLKTDLFQFKVTAVKATEKIDLFFSDWLSVRT